MTFDISLKILQESFLGKATNWGFRDPFDLVKQSDSTFDVDAELARVPKVYLQNLVSLDLAIQHAGEMYTIKEKNIEELTRHFAPVLVFDSKEKQAAHLGNLTNYLIVLFTKQYALVKENPPEKYKKFVKTWKENPTPEEFLAFLNELTDSGETTFPSSFFDISLKEDEFSFPLPERPKVYVNWISGKDNAVIQYYTFYPTNDENRFFKCLSKIVACVGKIFPFLKKYQSVDFHLADWERIEVYIKKNGNEFKQTAMTYVGHGKANIHELGNVAHKKVFVAEGGHATRPSPFAIDCMCDNCDGRGKSIDLADESVQFVPMSLHHLLLGNDLETRCLTSVIRHGPEPCPKSAIFQRSYAVTPNILEFIRLNKAWQPTQPVVGAIWKREHPALPDPNVAAWDPSDNF